MKEAILTAIGSAAAVGCLWWSIAYVRGRLDRWKVYRWLRTNTHDEPGESHLDTATLAKGTRLPEDRVRHACMSDGRIHRLQESSEQWSVWRKEPQSVYEKRGLFEL